MSFADTFRAGGEKRSLMTVGAFGTMNQTHRLDEAAYRGEFDRGFYQKGNNYLLVLTRPEIIADITRAYLDAGSDIASTNTFNANRISQADYGAEQLVAEDRKSVV